MRLIFNGANYRWLILFAVISVSSRAADLKFLSIGKVTSVTLRPGKKAEALIRVSIEKPFHIQTNPATLPSLIPTLLVFEPKTGISVGEPIYPAGKPYRLQGAQTEISVYGGELNILVPLTASASAKKGPGTLTGTLKFQACNDKICFFPSTVPVSVPYKVAGKKGS